MLDLHWENTDSKSKKLQGVMQAFMSKYLLFFQYFGSWNKEEKYFRHYMVALHYSGLLLTQIINHQLIINIRHTMLGNPVFSYYLISIIQMSKRWDKHPNIIFYFSTGKILI